MYRFMGCEETKIICTTINNHQCQFLAQGKSINKMPEFSEKLPEKFAYINDVLSKYTVSHGSVNEYNQLIDHLTPSQIEEIADLYRKIANSGNATPISEWINAQGYPTPREWELFVLFNALARKGIKPFSEREVEYTLPPKQLDWSKLPSELIYLCIPAMKYGKYWSHEQRIRLRSEISDADMAELARVAERLRAFDELERIWKWRQQHQGESEEELIAWLIDIVQEFIPDIPAQPEVLDWDKLPNLLQYLREPACKYGIYWLATDRERLLDEMNDEETVELFEIAQRVRSSEDQELIEQWFDTHPHNTAKHPEATLVYLFLEFLDEYVPEL